MRLLQIPRVDEIFSADASKYDYKKDFDEARQTPLAVFLTSGSTGKLHLLSRRQSSFLSIINRNAEAGRLDS